MGDFYDQIKENLTRISKNTLTALVEVEKARTGGVVALADLSVTLSLIEDNLREAKTTIKILRQK